MKAIHLLIISLLVIAGSAWAYDPMHDGGTRTEDQYTVDGDGDRNPGTQFNVAALGLSGEIAQISFVADGNRGSNPKNTFVKTGGGRIIDITTAPFGACSSVSGQPNSCSSGDSTANAANNTLAFQKAITFVLTTLYQSATCSGSPCNTYNAANPGDTNNYIIYVPNGTYLINDTLAYKTIWGGNHLWINGADYMKKILYLNLDNGENSDVVESDTAPTGSYTEAFARLRIIGQSRSGVIIKATGTWTAGKPMISFGNPLSGKNSSVSYNTLRHLTLQANNTGATGVQFSGANNAGMHNLWIKGGNSQGYGILVKSDATQGYHSDIQIDDFGVGIYSEPHHATQGTFEHITITGATTSVKTVDSGMSLRKLKITNASCSNAISVDGAGQVVLIDSWFDATSCADINAAIHVTSAGHAHTRGIKIGSNASSYNGNCSNVTGVSTLNTTLNCDGQSTLAIPPYNPSSYNYYYSSPYLTKIIHDQAELENCLSASSTYCPFDTQTNQKYMLFFTNATYDFVNNSNQLPYLLPTKIKLISFLYGSFTVPEGKFLFKSYGSETDGRLVIEDITSAGRLFNHLSGSRPVVLRHIGGGTGIYSSASPTKQTAYFESVGGLGKNIPLMNMNAWARGINTEAASTGLSNDATDEIPDDATKANFPIGGGTSLWVLGYKTEKNQPSFSLSDSDDRLEVLGGFANQREGAFSSDTDEDSPITTPYSIIAIKEAAVNAKVSYIGFTSGIGQGACHVIDPVVDRDNPEYHFDRITRKKIKGIWQETVWDSYPLRTIANRCNDIFIPLFISNEDVGVRFVDVDSTCTSSCGLSWSSAYQTIHEAVANLNSRTGGGTIYIDEGVYTEANPLTLIKPIDIIGAGMGVTSWEYSNTSGAAVEIAASGSGSRFSKLAIRPTNVVKSSASNGGIHINGAKNISIDQVLVWQFGNDGENTTYSDPSIGNSYCIKSSYQAAGLSITNSQVTFCNNGIVLMNAGSVLIDNTIVRDTRAGPALFVHSRVGNSPIKVTNSWFAMKASATTGEDYSKYLVYLDGGVSEFLNSETELDVTQPTTEYPNGTSIKSHHIYAGSNGNQFTNHKFISGANPDFSGDGHGGCSKSTSERPYAVNLVGNDNNMQQYIATSEGCGLPEVKDTGSNNTVWTDYQ